MPSYQNFLCVYKDNENLLSLLFLTIIYGVIIEEDTSVSLLGYRQTYAHDHIHAFERVSECLFQF
jgi:hypothetical protein